MATYNFKHIPMDVVNGAKEYADLKGIEHDFNYVTSYAAQLKDQLKELFEGKSSDHIFMHALTDAILVRYSRPFVPGKRTWLRENDLKSLAPNQKKAHTQLRQWRNKHIAHSVNYFEILQTKAHFCEERFDDEGFTHVSCGWTEVTIMGLDDVDIVIELASHFIDMLKPTLDQKENELLKAVNALPKEIVDAWEMECAPHTNDASKDRPN